MRPTLPDPFRDDDAAYVLGALSAVESSAFEHHMAGCPDCRASVDLLGALPRLLASVPTSMVKTLTAEQTPGE